MPNNGNYVSWNAFFTQNQAKNAPFLQIFVGPFNWAHNMAVVEKLIKLSVFTN